MMMFRFIGVLLLALWTAPLSLLAHDPSKHKGKPTEGEIVAATKDRLEIKTATGTKAVTLNEKTKVERGNQAAAFTDLKKGDHVMVFGTTLATGELVAREVLIGKAEAQAGHTGHKGAGKH